MSGNRDNHVGTSNAYTTDAGVASSSLRGIVRVQQLVVVSGPELVANETHTLLAASTEIGRVSGDGARIKLADSEVSRTHAKVTRGDDGRCAVVDCGSRNGTVVNGARVDTATLVDGDVVRIGRSTLVFVDVELVSGSPLAPEAHGLNGTSLRMQALRGDLALVAPRAIPVLVLGESGSGKERIARALHARSGRTGAFVAINCAAIPEALAESELFGHAPGAFTGATGRSDGVFVAAAGGTLFLDEVAELPASVQSKLLRTLATGEVKPVGRADARMVDVRIVAATHRDVAAEVSAATFRGDLFARLSAWVLHAPALRDRRDDILGFARATLAKHGVAMPVAPNAAEALVRFAWPYNVRQLENVVYAAAVRAERGGTLRPEHLPEEIARLVGGRDEPSAKQTMPPVPLEVLAPRDRTPTAEQLKMVLDHHEGNMARVAEFFGKDRKQIYRWAERLGVALRPARDDE